MSDRIAPPAKLLPMLAADGRLAQALAAVWQAQDAGRYGASASQWHALQEGALAALRAWAADGKRAGLQNWLLGLRQDFSLEELLLVLVQLDRALRQAGWQLGLPAPDWLALSEVLSGFFEALFEAAAAGWQGLLAQNHQLRDELAYFHRLAAARDSQSLDEHLHLAVRETARLLHCEFCAILLPQEGARGVLEIRAAVAPRILSNALAGMAFPLAENGLIAQVFLTGAPASTYQPLEDLEITMRRRQTLESLGFSQLMAYPLQTHGRVLGVLCVANRLDDQPWQALDEEWLATVAGQLSASIRLSQLQVRQENSEAELARALALGLALHDARLAAHGDRVGALAHAMGAKLGLSAPQLEQLELAGRLHDLGMLAVSPRVRERPGPLWPSEAAEVRRHPVLAAELLGEFKQLAGLTAAVRHHHERWDGEGYPDGLAGQAIPLEARLLAVADAYATLTTTQPYRAACAPESAIAELRREAGGQFDSVAVQALVEVVGEVEAPAPEPLPPAEPAALLAQAPRLIALLAELVAAPDEATFYAQLWDALARNCALDAATVHVVRSGGLQLARAHGFSGTQPVTACGLESYAAGARVPVAAADLAADARCQAADALAEGLRAAVSLPLVAADRLLGVLTVYRRQRAPWTAEEQTVLELAGAMLAQGLAAIASRARAEEPLAIDALTGLATHRVFVERLGAELARSARYDLPVSAVLLDLDDFEAYNEAQGYGLGDEALRQVAQFLAEQAGPADVVARYGADAFAVLLPERSAAAAMTLAESLRLAIAESPFPSRQAGGARLTACVGVASVQGGDRPTLLADLRTALARAQDEGHNRLLFHAAVPEEA